jgi:cobalt-zinc-cadmium efflux system protein
MSHDHHLHHHSHSGSIGMAFILNILFTVIEIVGGIISNSTAILADAIHDLGDSFTLGLSWYFERLSNKKPDALFSYGYRRFSLLGALISAIVLVTGSFFLLKTAIPRIAHPAATDARSMLWFSIVGVAVNGIAALRVAKNGGLNAKIVSLHLLEDVLGWVSILILSIILNFKDWFILDPIFSVAITVFVLVNVVRQLKKISVVFLQGVPENIDMNHIQKEIECIDGVLSCHHSHIWTMDGEHHSLTTHIVVAGDYSKENIIRVKQDVKALLRKHYIFYYTLEVEYEDEECGASFSS